MADGKSQGRFVWYDLMTSDPESAVDFYTRLVGWGTAPWQGEGDPYTMWTNNNVPLGGVMPLPEEAIAAGAPPHWIAYVSVPDANEAVALTEKLGGSVVMPVTDIPNGGCFAILQDPLGGAFAVYTSDDEAPATDEPLKAGQFSWHELATTDAEAAFDFYQAIFGWEKTEAMEMGKAGTYQLYSNGGPSLGGFFNKPDEVEGPPEWLYFIRVDDANRAALVIQMLGGQVLNGPVEVPGGELVAYCLDPQGGRFAIISVEPEEE